MAETGRFEPFNWRDFDPGELPEMAIPGHNEACCGTTALRGLAGIKI
jgi:hypothetical protein